MTDSAKRRVHVGGDVSGQIVVGDHNVIIHADGSSLVPAGGPPPVVRARTRPAGRPLPRPVRSLAGRDAELERLTAWLDDHDAVNVHGIPGIGKSALLRRIAADRAAAGTDVVFLSAAGLAVEDVVQELFQSCYEADGYRPEPARLRRLMGSIQALIVVDDFGGSADDFTTLLDATPASRLLVASTRRVMGPEGSSLEIGGLAEDAAIHLVGAALGRELTEEEQAAARRLCAASGGHPRAMLQAAAAVRADAGLTLTADSVALTRALVAGLGTPERTALGVLAALPGTPVTAELVGTLTGLADAGHALAALERVHLAESSGDRYTLAADAVPPTTERPEPDPPGYAERLTRWVRAAAPWEVADAAPVVVQVLTGAVRGEHHEEARDLARAAAPALARTLRWGAWREVLALGLVSARHLDAADDVAYFTHEDRIRRRTLGLAAGVATGAAAGGAVLAAHGAAATGGKAVGAVLTGHPAVIAGAAAVAVAAAVVGAGLVVRDQGSPADSSGPIASSPGPVRPVPPPSPSVRTSKKPPLGPLKLVPDPPSVPGGGWYTLIATGFRPGETVRFFMTSRVTTGQIGADDADESGRAEISGHAPQGLPPRPYPVSATGQASGRAARSDLWVTGGRDTGRVGDDGGNTGKDTCKPEITSPVNFGRLAHQDNGEPSGFKLINSGTTCEGDLATGNARIEGDDADLFHIARGTACPDVLKAGASTCIFDVILYATRSGPVHANLLIPGVGTPPRRIPLSAVIEPSTS